VSAERAAHPERFVTASELAEYAYCRRAWWLRAVRGEQGEGESARFAEGRSAHRAHARQIALARALLALAALLACGACIVWLVRRA